MGRKTKIGECHICGAIGPLTYEHIPPEGAFNEGRVIEPDVDLILASDTIDYIDNRRGRVNQRGVGKFSLCSSCNNNTGSWYVPSYIEFVRSLYTMSVAMPVFQSGMININIKPLNVIKQIFAMFCSANGPSFATANEDLIRFILNPSIRTLPPNMRLSIALYNPHESVVMRSSGIVSALDIEVGRKSVFSEIS